MSGHDHDGARVVAMLELAAVLGVRAVRCSGRGRWRMETPDGGLLAGRASLRDCERWLAGFAAAVRWPSRTTVTMPSAVDFEC